MKLYKFNSILDASKSLLAESGNILNQADINYIIVGGWSPYLLNHGQIQHPGTRDVDILFEEGSEPFKLREIIQMFLKEGYLVSAKHDFQLLKRLKVQNREFIFNVDLLHPTESRRNPELFVDHLELGIPINEYRSSTFMLKSIALPETRVLFDGFFTEHTVEAYNTEGSLMRVTLRLMDEAGCLITKAQSLNNVKRMRDAFDIFLSIYQCRDYNYTINKLLELKEHDRVTFNTLYGIKKGFDNGIMYNNINKYYPVDRKIIKQCFEKLISDLALDKKALSF